MVMLSEPTTTEYAVRIISNPADVVPEDRQERVIQAGYERSRACWVIGQEALDQKNENDAAINRGEVIEIADGALYAYFATLAGCAARTVREYVSICKYYPDYIREEFFMLSVDHFRFAMRFGDIDKARQILLAAKLQVDRNGGRPPTVEWLEAHFTDVDNVTDELTTFASEELAVRGLEKATKDPGDEQARLVVKHLTKLMLAVRKMVAPIIDAVPDVAQAAEAFIQALEEANAKFYD